MKRVLLFSAIILELALLLASCGNRNGVILSDDGKIVIGVTRAGKKKCHVDVPEGATAIGKSAFEACRNLESITIPHGVTKIEKMAFAYCISLKDITLPHLHIACRFGHSARSDRNRKIRVQQLRDSSKHQNSRRRNNNRIRYILFLLIAQRRRNLAGS